MDKTTKCHYKFGCFQLNLTQHMLLREKKEITLTPKLFETLRMLVEHHGEVLGREELIRAVWGDTCVEEGNLSTNIYALRKILGDEKAEATYIATVPRRGYRFVAPVEKVSAGPKLADEAMIRSLAVLPFKPLGAEGGMAGLGLGLTDALITRLSNLRQFKVRSTGAVRKYQGSELDPVLAGRELEADVVVDGNIQWADGRGRVTVQLVNVGNGSPFWGQPFDEPFMDVFSFEDAISLRVAEALTHRLQGPVQSHSWRTTPVTKPGASAQELLKVWL